MRISRVVMAPGGMPVPLSIFIELQVPLVGQSVHAGFPSPADDFIEEMIDLNQVLIQNATATFLWRVVGDCMIDVKIFPGDVVVVDRSLSPKHRSIVLAIIDGEPTLKRLNRRTPSCRPTPSPTAWRSASGASSPRPSAISRNDSIKH